MRKSLALAALLLSFLMTTGTFAGEWVPAPPKGNLSAIHYSSRGMSPGEQAILYYSGRQKNPDPFKYEDFNLVVLQLVLKSAPDEPIKGFDGVGLREHNDLKEDPIFQFYNYRPPTDLEKFMSQSSGSLSSDISCRTYDLEDLELGDKKAPKECFHACFLSLSDLQAQRNDVPCSSGRAHWVLVLLRGAVTERLPLNRPQKPDRFGSSSDEVRYKQGLEAYEKEQLAIAKAAREGGAYWKVDRLKRARYLIVRATMGTSVTHFDLAIDDAFRNALWGERRR